MVVNLENINFSGLLGLRMQQKKVSLLVSQMHIKSLVENVKHINTYYEENFRSIDLIIFPAYALSNNLDSIDDAEVILAKIAESTQGRSSALLFGAFQKERGIEKLRLYLVRNGFYNAQKTHFTINNFLIHAHLNTEDTLCYRDIEISFCISPHDIPSFCKRSFQTGIYINQVGGKDDVVFSGNSIIAKKNRVEKMAQWKPEDKVMHIDPADLQTTISIAHNPIPTSDLYDGIVFSLRNHLEQNGFRGVIIGISGGIDSALTMYIASEAVGSENVKCFMLPSKYTSQKSINDAYDCCNRLGVEVKTIPIHDIYDSFVKSLHPIFVNYAEDVTEENLQARIRGTLLMAISNKTGRMLLSTGNKSENLVGYATLYGDTCGGFAPLKHIYKTEVYEITKWINETKSIKIPENIILKAPTAELKFNQTDQDTLPPYEDLDIALKCLMNEKKRVECLHICHSGGSVEDFVRTRFEKSCYKRQQSPPGPNLSKQTYEAY